MKRLLSIHEDEEWDDWDTFTPAHVPRSTPSLSTSTTTSSHFNFDVIDQQQQQKFSILPSTHHCNPNIPLTIVTKSHKILNIIVNEAYHYPDNQWKEKFLSIPWHNVENYSCSNPISLSTVLFSTINFLLTDSDSNLLLQNYSMTSTNNNSSSSSKFLYKKFLFDFFTNYALLEMKEEQKKNTEIGNSSTDETTTTSTTGTTSTNGSTKNSNNLWIQVQKKLLSIQAVNVFKTFGKEKARHRALSLLLEAIGNLQGSRFGKGNMNFAAQVNRVDFKKYEK